MGFWLGLLLSGTVTEVALVVFSGLFGSPTDISPHYGFSVDVLLS